MAKKSIIFLVIIVAVLLSGSWFVFANKKSNTNVPSTNNTTSTQIDFKAISLDTNNWKMYTNSTNHFSFKYPAILGDAQDVGGNANVMGNIWFTSGDRDHLTNGWVAIQLFSNNSMNGRSALNQKALKDGTVVMYSPDPQSDGVAYKGEFPFSFKKLLDDKSVGYNCSSDFYDTVTGSTTCQVVEINGNKAFRTLSVLSKDRDLLQLSYIFYVNGNWIWFEKMFVDKNYNSLHYTPEQILGNQIPDSEIQAELNVINKIVSTLKIN